MFRTHSGERLLVKPRSLPSGVARKRPWVVELKLFWGLWPAIFR